MNQIIRNTDQSNFAFYFSLDIESFSPRAIVLTVLKVFQVLNIIFALDFNLFQQFFLGCDLVDTALLLKLLIFFVFVINSDQVPLNKTIEHSRKTLDKLIH